MGMEVPLLKEGDRSEPSRDLSASDSTYQLALVSPFCNWAFLIFGVSKGVGHDTLRATNTTVRISIRKLPNVVHGGTYASCPPKWLPPGEAQTSATNCDHGAKGARILVKQEKGDLTIIHRIMANYKTVAWKFGFGPRATLISDPAPSFIRRRCTPQSTSSTLVFANFSSSYLAPSFSPASSRASSPSNVPPSSGVEFWACS